MLTLDPTATGADFDHGLGYFNVTASAGDSFVMVLGRDQGGRWSIYLWGTRFYNATHLPASVTICGFGDGATVYSSTNPSSSKVATLDDGATVNSEQFILTISGAPPDTAPLARPGLGWYHLSDPSGWVYSKYVSATADCSLHDSLETR